MDIQYQKFKSLTLKQISYALAAADQGNVTAAARKLHVSQPAISAAIAALERHYGIKLFTRLPAQGVALTPFGVEVMSRARLLCDQAQTVATMATPEAKIAGEIGLSKMTAFVWNKIGRFDSKSMRARHDVYAFYSRERLMQKGVRK